jgi:hypothetical protein
MMEEAVSRRRRLDLAFALFLALLIGIGSYALSGRIDPVLGKRKNGDAWFDGDTARVFSAMTQTEKPQKRAYLHPLFAVATYPPTQAVRGVTGMDRYGAVRVVLALVAVLWGGLLFAFLRVLGCGRGDALLFGAVAGVSGAAVFWLTVPETWSFGSCTLLAALVAVGVAERRELPLWGWVTVGALTLGGTLTNWMAGIAAALVSLPRRQAVQVSAAAFAAIVAIWNVQKLVIASPSIWEDLFGQGQREAAAASWVQVASDSPQIDLLAASHLHGPQEPREAYFRRDRLLAPWTAVSELILAPMIAPRARVSRFVSQPLKPRLTMVGSVPWSGGAPAVAGILAWLTLLGMGAWSLRQGMGSARVRAVLGWTLAGQAALHLVYGRETFLYSLHFLPLLVGVAAAATLGRHRMASRALAVVLLACAAWSNGTQFASAATYTQQLHGFRLPGLRAPGAKLEGIDLQDADLAGADLHGADLWKSDLSGARLDRANLAEARLRDAKLDGAWLEGADLRKADLRAADLRRAHLRGAKLKGARYDRRTRWPKGFDAKARGARRG